jgi:O-antigen/teichoic acid export membrane protein
LYGTYFIFYFGLARIFVNPNEAGIGLISLLSSAQAVFTGAASLSLPSAATRFISASLAINDENSAGGIVKTILKMSVPAAVIGLLVAGIISPFLLGSNPTSSLGTILFVTFLASLFLDIVQLYTGFFIGTGRYAATLYQNIAYVPLSRGLGLFLAWRFISQGLEMGVFGVVVGWAVGGVASMLLSLYLWHGALPHAPAYPARPLLVFSLPVLASAMIILAQQWGDIWVFGLLGLSASDFGRYYLVVSSVTFLSVLWLPVSQAIYPALSASHSTGDNKAVSDRLEVAFRLTNLGVLPLGAALAGVAPTALLLVYGKSYELTQSWTLFILGLTAVFSAQGAILFVAMQAVGRTRQYLEVALTGTLIYLGIVAFGVDVLRLGTLAGAIGRGILAISIVLLARRSLHRLIAVHTMVGMKKAVLLGISVGLPIFVLDQIFVNGTFSGILGRPIVELIVMLLLFFFLFVVASRFLNVFHRNDFAIVRDALPRRVRPLFHRLERIVVKDNSSE